MRMSRRTFVAGAVGSAGAGLAALPRHASGQATPTPQIRYNADSPEGEAMLEKYARAVAKMMDTAQMPERDPRSWLSQWYTHAVNPQRSMAAEIERLYSGAAPDDPQRLIALAAWNTCQPHGQNGLQQD